jgi:hypothetical protein
MLPCGPVFAVNFFVGLSFKKVILIGSYPPQHGGIAAYTHNLRNAIVSTHPEIICQSMVISDSSWYDFPEEVVYTINKNNLSDYKHAANFINLNQFDIACIQHSGDIVSYNNDALFEFLANLQLPVITALHTTSNTPTDYLQYITDSLNHLSTRFVMSTQTAALLLQRIDSVHISKIDQISCDFPVHETLWTVLATEHIQSFEKAFQISRPAVSCGLCHNTKTTGDSLPALRFDHLIRLSDSTGVLQHAKFAFPDFSEGYCTDDNARALRLTVLLEQLEESPPSTEHLKSRTISFLNFAFNRKVGFFRNFMSFSRRWLDQKGSEDCHGRAIWALGTCVARTHDKGLRALANKLFNQALGATVQFYSPRGCAFVLLGLHEYLCNFEGDRLRKRLFDDLLNRLYLMFVRNRVKDWPWCEDIVTYDNGRIVQTLLLCGSMAKRMDIIDNTLCTLRWLLEIQTSMDGYFRPVGSDGFYVRGKEPAMFDQQPLEASAMISACIAAYTITQDHVWFTAARRIFEWFLGENDLGLPVYDSTNGGCNDAIQRGKVNQNQGSESTISFLMALAEMRLFQKQVLYLHSTT